MLISHDIHGHSTLDKLSKANRINAWIYKTIKPRLNGRIIEIGSGIGNISSFIAEDGHQLMITEANENYLEILNKKFDQAKFNTEILHLNLVDPEFDLKFQQLFKSFDTVIAINVMEHIVDDLNAFENAQKLLKQHGRFIVLVPNSESLFNKLDQSLGHIRRYDKTRIHSILNQIGMHQDEFFYFNTIGVVGWWISGNLFRHQTIPQFLVNVFECLIPYTSWLDKLFRNHFGLSIIVVGSRERI